MHSIATWYLIITAQFAQQYDGYCNGNSCFGWGKAVKNSETIHVTALNSLRDTAINHIFTGIPIDSIELEPEDFPQDTLLNNQ